MPQFDTINSIELEGIDLDLTSFVWPFYRGCDYVPVEIRQAGDRFEELLKLKEAAADEFAGGLTMLVEYEENGLPSILEIKGIQLVEGPTKIDEGRTGTRIVLADARYLLSKQPMTQSWNLLYGTKYQRDTAKDENTPLSLYEMLSKLPEVAPKIFAGRMADEALEQIAGLGVAAEIPPDQGTAGTTFAAALQKLLEQWGFDLCVTADGKFYFADRSEVGFDTYSYLDQIGEDLNWIGKPPDWKAIKANAQVPKFVLCPYWEDHILEVPHLGGLDKGATTVTGTPKLDRKKYPHGLMLRQVFELGDTYVDLPTLLSTLGFDPLAIQEVSGSPRASLGALMMNPTLFDSVISPVVVQKTSGLASEEYRNSVAATGIIKKDVRQLFAVVPDTSDVDRAVWLSLAPGRIDKTGIIRDARPVGTYTLLFNRAGEHIPMPGRPSPDLGAIFGPERGRPEMPFEVAREGQGELVVRLQFKNLDGVPAADAAVIGIPRKQSMLTMFGPLASLSDLQKNALSKAGIDLSGSTFVHTREDIQFVDDYQFAIYVVGRRYYPNDERKWWIEKIDVQADIGIEGAVEEVMLNPSEELFCRRDHLYAFLRTGGLEGTVAAEANRPNGNDGFGKCLNRDALRADARRRARAYVESLDDRAGPNVPFASIEQLGIQRIIGRIDSWALHVNGRTFTGEVAIGPRPNELARTRQAFLDQAQRKLEIGGKRFK